MNTARREHKAQKAAIAGGKRQGRKSGERDNDEE